jgi:hypothetical protein
MLETSWAHVKKIASLRCDSILPGFYHNAGSHQPTVEVIICKTCEAPVAARVVLDFCLIALSGA